MGDLSDQVNYLKVENDKLKVKLVQTTKDYGYLEVMHDYNFDNLTFKQSNYITICNINYL